MRICKTVSILAIAVTLASIPLFAGTASGEDFNIVVMADPQLGHTYAYQCERYNQPYEHSVIEEDVLKFGTAVEQINHISTPPDFVVVCGDLVNVAGHELQTSEYLRIQQTINPYIPFYTLPGNHDIEYNNSRTLEQYRSVFGMDRFSFTHNNWHFICLNSVLMQHPEAMPDETEAQWSWLRENLENAADADVRGTVIFMHHPIFLEDIDEVHTYKNIPVDERRKYLDLFDTHNVTAVVSGHTHTAFFPEQTYKGVRLINLTAVCNAFDDKPGMYIFKFLDTGLAYTFHPYDGLPDQRILPAPSRVQIDDDGVGPGICITWDPAPGEDEIAGYHIFRSRNSYPTVPVLLDTLSANDNLTGIESGGMVRIGTVSPGVTLHRDTAPMLDGEHYYYWLASVSDTGQLSKLARGGFFTTRADTIPGPATYTLYTNSPNPFNPVTNIRYNIGGRETKRVLLVVHNICGGQVKTLVDRQETPGLHHVRWDGTDDEGLSVSSGVYIYRLVVDGESATKSMTLVK